MRRASRDIALHYPALLVLLVLISVSMLSCIQITANPVDPTPTATPAPARPKIVIVFCVEQSAVISRGLLQQRRQSRGGLVHATYFQPNTSGAVLYVRYYIENNSYSDSAAALALSIEIPAIDASPAPGGRNADCPAIG